MTASWRCGLLGVVVVCAAAEAFAQDAGSLAREGFAARQQGDDARALALFERALVLRPSAMLRAQVALAEQALGRWRAAETHLAAAVSEDDPWIVRHRAALAQSLAEVRQHLGSLVVVTSVDHAAVRFDQEVVGTTPMEAPVRWPAGTVTVVVEADGYYPFERPSVVRPGLLTREEVTLRPLPPARPPEPAVTPVVVTPTVVVPSVVTPPVVRVRRPARPGVWTRVGAAPWVLGGVGVVVGVVGGSLAWAERADAVASLRALGCVDGTNGGLACPQAQQTAAEAERARGATAATLVNVAWISGASLLAGALVWGVARAAGGAPSGVACGAEGCTWVARF